MLDSHGIHKNCPFSLQPCNIVTSVPWHISKFLKLIVHGGLFTSFSLFILFLSSFSISVIFGMFSLAKEAYIDHTFLKQIVKNPVPPSRHTFGCFVCCVGSCKTAFSSFVPKFWAPCFAEVPPYQMVLSGK